MNEPIHAILIGAGQRGTEAYGPYALQHPDQLRFVAVAEPDPARRARFAAMHQVAPENQYESWEPLLDRPQLGQAALVCTQDWQHTAPALAALRAGYHVLLEKPMATSATDCQALVQASRNAQRQLHICHVLRYTSHFQTMREIIQAGILGQVTQVDHRENVSFYHMAHSFVRGSWRSSAESSPMILAKCCHDLDLLPWLLDRRCTRLSSVGALLHYRPENAPPGAPLRCLDGCPAQDTCPYYAPDIYIAMRPLWRGVALGRKGLQKWAVRLHMASPALSKTLGRVVPAFRLLSEYKGWPRSVVALDPTPENLTEALRTGPYGRCVYHCDNDVVDHQVVSMEFEGQLSVTLTMHGHAHLEGRSTRIQGARAELQAFFGTGGSWIKVYEHRSGRTIHYDTAAQVRSGHGGGDHGLLAAFLRSLADPSTHPLTTAEQALESHLLAFAAEEARLSRQTLEASAWR